MAESPVLLERRDSVGLITLNRPAALNALSNAVLAGLADGLEELDRDETVRVIVLTGGPKVFAAGADLKQLAEARSSAAQLQDFLSLRFGYWDRIRSIRSPIIGAVAG